MAVLWAGHVCSPEVTKVMLTTGAHPKGEPSRRHTKVTQALYTTGVSQQSENPQKAQSTKEKHESPKTAKTQIPRIRN